MFSDKTSSVTFPQNFVFSLPVENCHLWMKALQNIKEYHRFSISKEQEKDRFQYSAIPSCETNARWAVHNSLQMAGKGAACYEKASLHTLCSWKCSTEITQREN
jgi:hypothetical protein